jgi:hypothetical protein
MSERPRSQAGPPVMLGNMRELGVRVRVVQRDAAIEKGPPGIGQATFPRLAGANGVP